MRHAWPFMLFLGTVLILALSLGRDADEVPSPFIGKPAPALSLPSLLSPDQTVSLEQYAGRAFAVNVWGSWCPACYDEHDFLLALAKQKTVPIVGLNWKDTREEATRWLAQLGNPYEDVAFDAAGDVGINWGVYGAPETFLVNHEGVVVYKHVGPLTADVWQQEFMSRLQ